MDYKDYNPHQHNLFVTFRAPECETCGEAATWGDGEYYYCNAHGNAFEIDETCTDAAPLGWQPECITAESEPLPKHYVGYCVNCGEGHHLENGLCQNCRPITPAAQAIIKPEWDAMQDFITQMGERLQGGE